MQIPDDYEGGASLPKFYRNHIERCYPSWVIIYIDRAGRVHDWLTDRYPDQKRNNRKIFKLLQEKYNIPKTIIRKLCFGLWVYDHSPKIIQKLLQKTS